MSKAGSTKPLRGFVKRANVVISLPVRDAETRANMCSVMLWLTATTVLMTCCPLVVHTLLCLGLVKEPTWAMVEAVLCSLFYV